MQHINSEAKKSSKYGKSKNPSRKILSTKLETSKKSYAKAAKFGTQSMQQDHFLGMTIQAIVHAPTVGVWKNFFTHFASLFYLQKTNKNCEKNTLVPHL